MSLDRPLTTTLPTTNQPLEKGSKDQGVDDVIDVATQTDMDGIDVGVQTDILLYQQVQLLNLLNSYRAVKSSSALRESRNPRVSLNSLQELTENLVV